ncbi:MAG: ATP-binding cassette domain-containing protein [Myxococcota bacterium]
MGETLEVRGLDVDAPDGAALLRGVRLTLDPGEERSVVGRSGLGKSTLLRTLAGLHVAPGGAVRLGGRSFGDEGPARWRRRIAYAHQAVPLGPDSVGHTLARPFAYASSRERFVEARAREGLRALGLDDEALWERDAGSLSVGEQQRVHVLRALLVAEDVALLDEPDAALDVETVALLDSYLTERRRTGLSVLRISHRPAPEARTLDLEAFRAPGRSRPMDGA